VFVDGIQAEQGYYYAFFDVKANTWEVRRVVTFDLIRVGDTRNPWTIDTEFGRNVGFVLENHAGHMSWVPTMRDYFEHIAA
jgi:hypothetical protein